MVKNSFPIRGLLSKVDPDPESEKKLLQCHGARLRTSSPWLAATKYDSNLLPVAFVKPPTTFAMVGGREWSQRRRFPHAPDSTTTVSSPAVGGPPNPTRKIAAFMVLFKCQQRKPLPPPPLARGGRCQREEDAPPPPLHAYSAVSPALMPREGG